MERVNEKFQNVYTLRRERDRGPGWGWAARSYRDFRPGLFGGRTWLRCSCGFPRWLFGRRLCRLFRGGLFGSFAGALRRNFWFCRSLLVVELFFFGDAAAAFAFREVRFLAALIAAPESAPITVPTTGTPSAVPATAPAAAPPRVLPAVPMPVSVAL